MTRRTRGGSPSPGGQALVEEPAHPPGRPRRGMPRIAAYAALASLVLPLTSLLSGPLLARALGPEGRGEFQAVMAPLFVLAFVANVGLPEATTYGIARLRVRPLRVLARVAALSLTYALVAGVALWLLAPALLHKSPDAIPVLRWVVLALPFFMLTIILRFAVTGMRRFQSANVERVLNPVVRLVAIVALFLAGGLTVASAVTAQVGAMIAGGLYLLSVVLRRRTHEVDAPAEPARLTRNLASYGLRGWPGVFGNLVNWRLDQLVLVALVAPAQLGFYAVAVSLAELPGAVTNALRNVLFAESAHRDSLALVARAVRAALVLLLLAAGIGCLLAPVAVRVLFGEEFEPATSKAQVLLLASVPFGLEQLLAAGLLASGHPGKRAIGQLVAAALTIGGLVLLAPRYGAMGAALTSLLAYSVNCLISLLVFRRVSGLPVRAVLLPTPGDIAWLVARVRRRRRPEAPAAGV